jgi:hypothetical protein
MLTVRIHETHAHQPSSPILILLDDTGVRWSVLHSPLVALQ